MEQGKEDTGGEVCKFCGKKLWAGAAFCVYCGNAVGAEVQESEWGDPVVDVKGACPLTVLQKLVWGLVIAVGMYGGYVLWSGKILTSTVVSSSRHDDAAADVSAAEERLRELRRSFAEEDARKKKEAKEDQERFNRQAEEAKSLRKEFLREEAQ